MHLDATTELLAFAATDRPLRAKDLRLQRAVQPASRGHGVGGGVQGGATRRTEENADGPGRGPFRYGAPITCSAAAVVQDVGNQAAPAP